jgi:hypothetical protein
MKICYLTLPYLTLPYLCYAASMMEVVRNSRNRDKEVGKRGYVMKLYVYIVILAIFYSKSLYSQENTYTPASSCPNFNAFINSTQISAMDSLVFDINDYGVILLNSEKLDSLNTLIQLMGIGFETTFEPIKESKSRFDSTKIFRKYQQYYNGLKVIGGGYTTAYIGPGGLNDPVHPCMKPYMLIPSILTDVSINTNPTVQVSAITSILNIDNIDTAVLLISHNLLNECEYKLTWKVNYLDSIYKTAWIDAHTGMVILTQGANPNHSAPTITYGPQYLDNKTMGMETTLESPDGKIRVYDFCNSICPSGADGGFDSWTTDLIPTTTHPTEWTTESTPYAYQAFWTSSQVVPLFSEKLNIEFGNVNVANCCGPTAIAVTGSTMEHAYIALGIHLSGAALALYDIVAHELGHVLMWEFLNYTNLGNKTIHEGMADIIGTYIESFIPGNNGVDWVMGDDELDVANWVARNLQNPQYNCYTDVVNLNDQHKRSLPLGHLFYSISQGDQTNGIPSLGMDHTIKILLGTFDLFPPNPNIDYPNLMMANLTFILDEFGRCSDEFLALARAWEKICVPTGWTHNGIVPTCTFVINGPDFVCEESSLAHFCISGGLPDYHYRWYIIGPKSTEYTSECGMQGNIQEGCTCLKLVQFPKYPYYPQYITIKVYSSTAGPQYTQYAKFMLRDCDFDDPTCEEYYGSSLKGPMEDQQTSLTVPSEINSNAYKIVRVYDILGRLIHEKWTDQFDKFSVQYRGMVVVVYLDENEILMNAEKAFLNNY